MKYVVTLGLFIFNFKIIGQTASWYQLCQLDQRMIHSSGILTLNKGETFWTQVDNSSPNELYEIDKKCSVLRTHKILNVQKTDWEEITTDDQGTIYIGDFGNNNNDRTNLKIYVLKNVDQHTADTITPEVITFCYANQKEFPPPASHQNFDMEAMVWYHDSLHLFSKNRTSPFTGYTYQYALPALPGNYNLLPIDSFKTGAGPMLFFWITGAAFNQRDKQLILLSHDRIWMFTDFESSRFFQGKSRMITLPTFSQKEGICYAKEKVWYITDEYNSTLSIGGNLYEMKLDPITHLDENEEVEFEIHPNPVSEFLQVFIPDRNGDNELKFYNFVGKLCMNYTINKLRTFIPIQDLDNGIYFIKMISRKLKRSLSKKIIVIK